MGKLHIFISFLLHIYEHLINGASNGIHFKWHFFIETFRAWLNWKKKNMKVINSLNCFSYNHNNFKKVLIFNSQSYFMKYMRWLIIWWKLHISHTLWDEQRILLCRQVLNFNPFNYIYILRIICICVRWTLLMRFPNTHLIS